MEYVGRKWLRRLTKALQIPHISMIGTTMAMNESPSTYLMGNTRTFERKPAKFSSVDMRLLVSLPDGNDRVLDILTSFKNAAMAMPSVPTPQFPLGLAKVTPKSVSSAPLKATATTGTTKATNFTQVHSQPSVVNQSAYSGAKSVPAPSVKR